MLELVEETHPPRTVTAIATMTKDASATRPAPALRSLLSISCSFALRERGGLALVVLTGAS
ncbi:MAG: hypothetical protein ACXWNZ_09315 [Vulcanimicrobiaceae bacterium]